MVDFWQTKFRDVASSKPSLTYFKPQFMTLQTPHPLWTTSKDNPFEINKSLVVAKMLSGQYRSDWHSRHWSKLNKDGFCPLCPESSTPGTLEHMLVACPALDEKRMLIFNFWSQQSQYNHHLQNLLQDMLSANMNVLVQFLLDPSVEAKVISGCQQKNFTLEEVFTLTRTYCYGLHRRRLQLIGRFNHRS